MCLVVCIMAEAGAIDARGIPEVASRRVDIWVSLFVNPSLRGAVKSDVREGMQAVAGLG